MHTSLKKARGSTTKEASNVPDTNTFGELGFVVPRAKQEDDNRGEPAFEEANHEAESIHLLRSLGRSLRKAPSQLATPEYSREGGPAELADKDTEPGSYFEGDHVGGDLDDGEGDGIHH